MAGIPGTIAGFVIPGWAKIAAPIIGILIILAAFGWWSHHQYSKGEAAGEQKVEDEWHAADAKLRAQAAQSATRADDLAIKRAEDEHAQADADRKAVEDAKAKGASPLDAIFGN